MTEFDTIDDLFKDENVPDSNWFKFEKVGDKIGGTLVEVRQAPASGVFGPQRVFSLKTVDGTIMNVGIPMNKDYIIQRTNTVKLGDVVGFQFMKEIPSKTPGFAPAKSIEVFIKHADLPEDTAS